MCLTIKRELEKRLLFVITRRRRARHYRTPEKYSSQKESKSHQKYLQDENLINLISLCVHRLSLTFIIFIDNSFDLLCASPRALRFLFGDSTTQQIQLIARVVVCCNYLDRTLTDALSRRKTEKFFWYFRFHFVPFTAVPALFRSCSFQGQIITFDNYWIISLIYFHMFHVWRWFPKRQWKSSGGLSAHRFRNEPRDFLSNNNLSHILSFSKPLFLDFVGSFLCNCEREEFVHWPNRIFEPRAKKELVSWLTAI